MENIRPINSERGVILIELLIVVMIIGLLVTGAVKTWDTVIAQTRFTKTEQEMQELVYAIVGNPDLITEGRRTDFGYVGDMGMLPDSLVDLVIKPGGTSDSCWRGPYIKSKFTENSNDYLTDAWGNNYIYNKESLNIRSYASGNHMTPNTWVNKKIANSKYALLRNTVSGYVKDLVNNPPGYHNQYLSVYITYPLNGNVWTPIGFIPNEDGFYIIPDIPQGNHRMICVYDTTLLNPTDTTDYAEKYVCVFPGIQNTINFKLTVKF